MDCTNIYRAARMAAAKTDPLFSSRERAAACLYVSQDALQDYETSKTLPPCDVVQRMVEEYAAPDLRRQHIQSCCPLIPDYGMEHDSDDLPRAALGWACEFSRISDSMLRFAEIARDGKITDDEYEDTIAIRDKAIALRQLMESTIDSIDKHMARPNGGRL